MRVFRLFSKNEKVLMLALLLSFTGPIIHAFGLPWQPAEYLFIGLLMAPLSIICIQHWLRIEERQSAYRRFRQNPTLQIIAFLYLGTLWISAMRTGLHPKLRDLLGITAAVVFTHIVFPILSMQRAMLVLVLKASVTIGMSAIVFCWVMLFVKWVSGWNGGVMLLKDLILEKKMLAGDFGLPYLLKGPFLYPNMVGLLVLMMVPCLLYLRKTAELRRGRRLFEASLVLCALTFIASLSILSMIPAILVIMGFLAGKRKLFHQAVSLGALGVILFFIFIIIGRVDVGFLKILPVPGETRIKLWNQASELIHASRGAGIDPDQAVAKLPYGLTSHNTFYETALIYGIPALIALALYLAALSFILRPRSDDPLALAIFYLFISWLIMQCVEVLFLGQFGILTYQILILAIPFSMLEITRNQV